MNPLTARAKLRQELARRQPERRQRNVMMHGDALVLAVLIVIACWLAAWSIYDFMKSPFLAVAAPPLICPVPAGEKLVAAHYSGDRLVACHYIDAASLYGRAVRKAGQS